MKFNQKSKILYVSDGYAKNVMGTKRSLFLEFKRRGFDIDFFDIHTAGKNKISRNMLINQLKRKKYDWMFIAHTWVDYEDFGLNDINYYNVKVVGFGFSDPYNWDGEKLKKYNYYVTNSINVYNELLGKYEVHYNATACDLKYHKNLKLNRTIDILTYGRGMHPFFRPTDYRIDIMNRIKSIFKDKNITVFGNEWKGMANFGIFEGEKFLRFLNRAKVILDLEQEDSPPAHRMFEGMACGTPVITFDRPEIRKLLVPGKDVLVYDGFDNLVLEIERILGNTSIWEEASKSCFENTVKNHSIKNRANDIINWLKGL